MSALGQIAIAVRDRTMRGPWIRDHLLIDRAVDSLLHSRLEKRILLIFQKESAISIAPLEPLSATVLLLEPQPLYRAALGSLLAGSSLAISVISTSTLEECRAMLADSDIDVVVAAITPSLPPRRVLATLADAHSGVPVLFLGEPTDLQGRIDALRAGGTGALTRDASPEEFMAALQAALRGRRSMDEALADRLLSTAVDLDRSLAQAALSATEREILGMLGVAWSTRAIADARGISPKSVRNHVTNIYRKLGFSSRPEAVRYAARMGMRPASEEAVRP